MQQNIPTFILSQKQKRLLMRVNIDDVFESIYTTIILNIQKYIGKGLGLIIDSVVDHTIDISKFNPLADSSYIKLTKELDHIIKDFINIQDINYNKCFKWYLVRYVYQKNQKG